MREDLLSLVHPLHFRFGILKGPEVVIGSVNGFAGGHSQHGFVFIRPEHRHQNRGKCDQNDNSETHHGHLVFLQAADAILEGGR